MTKQFKRKVGSQNSHPPPKKQKTSKSDIKSRKIKHKSEVRKKKEKKFDHNARKSAQKLGLDFHGAKSKDVSKDFTRSCQLVHKTNESDMKSNKIKHKADVSKQKQTLELNSQTGNQNSSLHFQGAEASGASKDFNSKSQLKRKKSRSNKINYTSDGIKKRKTNPDQDAQKDALSIKGTTYNGKSKGHSSVNVEDKKTGRKNIQKTMLSGVQTSADGKPRKLSWKQWKRSRNFKKSKSSKSVKQSDKGSEMVQASSKDRKTTTKSETAPISLPPKDPQKFSSNWKQLQQTLEVKPQKASLGSNTDRPNPHKQHKKRKEWKKDKDGAKIGMKTNKDSSDIGKKTAKDGADISKKSADLGKPDIWFDDVDEIFLGKTREDAGPEKMDPLTKPGSYTGLTKAVAMDCEMVGTGEGGHDNMLARVSIVNQNGNCVYDTFVRPKEKVTDYRTHVSGVRRGDIKNGKDFSAVQKEVSEVIKGRILVGHALHNDLRVLYLSHPRHQIRDTQRYKKFRQLFNGRLPALKKLCDKVLGVQVQQGEHSSIQDAQAAMRLYTMYKKHWEKLIKLKVHRLKKSKKKKTKNEMECVLSVHVDTVEVPNYFPQGEDDSY